VIHLSKTEEGDFMRNIIDKKLKASLRVLSILVMGVAGLYFQGCGGSTPTTIGGIAGEGSPTGVSSLSVSAGANSQAAVISSQGVASKDQSSGSSGTGSSGSPPITSIYDTASSGCAFSSSTSTTSSGITVVTGTSPSSTSCSDLNKCIVCTETGNGTSACGFSCTGVIPSNAATAADSFNATLTFTSTFDTNMPAAAGAIRLDAERTTTGGGYWTAMSLDSLGTGNGTGVNLTGCTSATTPSDNGELTLDTVDNDPMHVDVHSGGSTTDINTLGLEITTLGPGANQTGVGTSNLQTCTVTTTFTATIPLTGASTPGTQVSTAFGAINYMGTICDDSSNCPGPSGY